MRSKECPACSKIEIQTVMNINDDQTWNQDTICVEGRAGWG